MPNLRLFYDCKETEIAKNTDCPLGVVFEDLDLWLVTYGYVTYERYISGSSISTLTQFKTAPVKKNNGALVLQSEGY